MNDKPGCLSILVTLLIIVAIAVGVAMILKLLNLIINYPYESILVFVVIIAIGAIATWIKTK